ncbi:MAG: hypothetical protein K2N56_06975 [Oscillospiraceae bacterium]|nr:hypothetical protein [Oscillospiraceae bacterium]
MLRKTLARSVAMGDRLGGLCLPVLKFLLNQQPLVNIIKPAKINVLEVYLQAEVEILISIGSQLAAKRSGA